jgi:hypothetical protein
MRAYTKATKALLAAVTGISSHRLTFASLPMAQSVLLLRNGLGEAGVRIPAEAREFYFLRNVKTGSVAQTASYSVDMEGSFPWVRRLERKFYHSLRAVARLRMSGAIHLSPLHAPTARRGTSRFKSF